MNWACDLYIYEHVDGFWTIHVAGRRRVGELPPEADWSLIDPGHKPEAMDEFMRQYNANMDAAKAAEMVAITLPHAGETFDLSTPGECADKVEELVALGYVCPDCVVVELREEQAEMVARLREAVSMSVAQMEIVRQRLEEAGLGNLGAGPLGAQCDFNRAALQPSKRGAG